MVTLTDADTDAALERGRAARLREPRAESACYDRQLDRLVVELTNGCTFAFPPRLVQGLQAATGDQLVQVVALTLCFSAKCSSSMARSRANAARASSVRP